MCRPPVRVGHVEGRGDRSIVADPEQWIPGVSGSVHAGNATPPDSSATPPDSSATPPDSSATPPDRHVPGMDPLKDVTVSVDVVWVDEPSDSYALQGTSNRPVPPIGELSGPDEVLRVEHVAKRFGGLVALRDINLHLRRGETLGLIGDNGSGKSTLIRIIAGFQTPDAGRIMLRGAPVALKSVDHARSLGIECVYQDLALVDQLSVWENVFLRREAVRRHVPLLARRQMRAQARTALDELGVYVASVDLPVGRLSAGQRQAVAIARSMRSAAQILLLDEPLAAMGAKESAVILDVIARVREQTSVSIVLVAHNYADVMEFCDRVNVIEDGSIALDTQTSDTSVTELTRRMTASIRDR
jgi:simple sugar transport system ATP-binding protein